MAESNTGWRTVIQGLQDRSRLRIKEGLRSFIVVDNHEAVQVGDFEKKWSLGSGEAEVHDRLS